MALSQRLLIRQGQALVMTPQLMQAIKLLQLSNLDLAAYVEGELESNPLLERAKDEELPAVDTPAQAEADAGTQGPADDIGVGDWLGGELETSREAIEGRLDTSLENVFPDDGAPAAAPTVSGEPAAPSQWAGVGAGGGDGGDYNIESFLCAETTLADHLTAQMALAIADPAQRMIARHLIDLVDEAGYLAGDVADVAEKLGATQGEVEAVLAALQALDPPGICARNLAECLAIQLRERDRYDPAMAALVGRLDLVARRDMAALRRICGVDDEDLADMIGEIRALNPKPGLAFGSTPVQPVVPDVYVRRSHDGAYDVELNNDTLPRVLVSQAYYARVAKSARDEREKIYFSECFQNATWLARALDQRARTILKVASEIVRQQDAFFAHGVRHLRPLNLKTVADAIAMHESTVSRVTANKYMATARGTFELKYFFTAAIAATDGGEAHSAQAVRERVRQLVDAESAQAVLSDDAIVRRLRADGIDIARRTVAKYRDALRIPSSVQRRREKLAAAAT
ncbi:MAG: RNA polymerase factor sigma-54 [Proteobacteria bacterium]|nr:RNA polymerase factor sigma-54 [Pseudomonadota bacterium]